MPKYVIAGGQFTPFSYDELIKPVQDSAEAHLKTQEALDALAMQAGDIASQIGIAEDGQNSKTLELYNRYEDLLRTAGEDLYNNGYNAVSARGLSLARQAYGRDITKIQHAIENRAKMAELYRKAANSDPTYMAEFNPATRGLDNWIDNPQYGDWRYYSGNTLVGQGNQLGSHIHDQLREDEAKWRSILGNQYYERWTKYGVTAEEINDAVAKMKAGESSDTYKNSSNANQHHVGVLMDAISNIYNSSKMGDWADNQTRDRAYDFIGQGLYSGIAKPQDKQLDNKDFITAYQKEILNRQSPKKDSSGPEQDAWEPRVSNYFLQTENYNKVRKDIEKNYMKAYEGGKKYLIKTPDGQVHEVKDVETATKLIYENNPRIDVLNTMNIDIGDLGLGVIKPMGEVIDSVTGTKRKVKVDNVNGRTVVKITGDDGKLIDTPHKQLTEFYNKAVADYNNYIAKIKELNPDIDIEKIAVTPKKMNDLRERYGYTGYGIDGTRSLIEGSAYIGNVTGRFLAGSSESAIQERDDVGSDLSANINDIKGGKDKTGQAAIRYVDRNGNITDHVVKDYSEIFPKDDGKYIINGKTISYINATPSSVAAGGFIVGAGNKTVFVPASLFSGVQYQRYINDRQTLVGLLSNALYNPRAISKYDEATWKALESFGITRRNLNMAIKDPEYRSYLQLALDKVLKGTSAGGSSIAAILKDSMRTHYQATGQTSTKEPSTYQDLLFGE